jgi:hypothetical protein
MTMARTLVLLRRWLVVGLVAANLAAVWLCEMVK